MPALMGYMISSLKKNKRAFGNGIAMLIQNLVGYLPAPLLYGYLNQLGSGQESRNGMIMLTFWTLWGIFFLVLVKLNENSQKNDHQEQNLLLSQMPFPEHTTTKPVFYMPEDIAPLPEVH